MREGPQAGAGQVHDQPSGRSAEGVERWRFSRASVRLTLANAAFSAITLISGPILARALGPGGRGDLAAILVPLAWTPAVAVLGQDIFATREAARGRAVGTLLLSVGALLFAIGLLVALLGIPLSSLLAQDRDVVRTYLLIGFATMPVVLLCMLLIGVSTGLERWRLVIVARLVPICVTLVGLVALFVAGSLTVGSAAAVYISVSVGAILLVSPVLRHRRFRFDASVVREGIPFGAKAWAGHVADLANARLDQLLMITLVAPRELGLYVVAANVGSFAWVITGGISPPLLARISAGEVELAPRALRTVLAVLAVLTVVVAGATPWLLDLLFGSDFADAAEPAWILLAAGLPFAGAEILKQTLNGIGRPGLPAIGQAAALLVTVPGLLVLLPMIGIVGAALVSLVAYTVNFVILLIATIKICRMKLSELLVPNRDDLAWLLEFVRSRIRFREPAGRADPK